MRSVTLVIDMWVLFVNLINLWEFPAGSAKSCRRPLPKHSVRNREAILTGRIQRETRLPISGGRNQRKHNHD